MTKIQIDLGCIAPPLSKQLGRRLLVSEKERLDGIQKAMNLLIVKGFISHGEKDRVYKRLIKYIEKLLREE